MLKIGENFNFRNKLRISEIHLQQQILGTSIETLNNDYWYIPVKVRNEMSLFLGENQSFV